MTPPLPQLVSMAASPWRSTATTSCPAFLRYQAVAVPTAPAPRTTVVISRPPGVSRTHCLRNVNSRELLTYRPVIWHQWQDISLVRCEVSARAIEGASCVVIRLEHPL